MNSQRLLFKDHFNRLLKLQYHPERIPERIKISEMLSRISEIVLLWLSIATSFSINASRLIVFEFH